MRSGWKKYFLTLLAGLWVACSLSINLYAEDSAQDLLSDEGSVSTKGDEAMEILPLKPGDRLLVKIFPEDSYIKGGEMEVNPEGNITLPLVGKIHIGDMTIVQAEEAITHILAADYFVNPEVAIERRVQEKTTIGPSFLVLGAVRQPGTYHMQPDSKGIKLLGAISLAGGFSDVANPKKIKIVREKNGVKSSLRVNAEDILEGKESDVPIKGGDIIHVSESMF